MNAPESLFADVPNERHLHPLTLDEAFEVEAAVKAMIAVLPESDDARGEARARLVSALAKLEKHWCPWCPVEVRYLGAIAHNAVVNYGDPGRERRKINELARAVTRYRKPLDDHFRESRTAQSWPDDCVHQGCEIRPGGTFHGPNCPAGKP